MNYKKDWHMTHSNQQRFVYFVTPKCATRSILAVLESQTKITLKEGYRPFNKKWDNYFKFAIVRNPWDRLLSCFLDKTKKCVGSKWELPDYSKYKQSSFKTFVRKISSTNLKTCNNHHRLQAVLVPYSECDFIGRFENLQEDFNIICDKIGLPKQKLAHQNKTNHKHYTQYYDDETRELVAKMYALDIKVFGYEFGER